ELTQRLVPILGYHLRASSLALFHVGSKTIFLVHLARAIFSSDDDKKPRRIVGKAYQIAEKLIVGVVTVNFHVSNILSKLGVSTRAAATRYAIGHGLA